MLVELLLGLIVVISVLILWRLFSGGKEGNTINLLEEKHRQMLVDINDALNKLSDRFNKTVSDELTATRESLQKLQLSQQESLAKIREDVIEKLHTTLSEQGKSQQDSLQNSLKNTSLQLIHSVENLTKSVDDRLQEITGKVHERLEEGFKKTNDFNKIKFLSNKFFLDIEILELYYKRGKKIISIPTTYKISKKSTIKLYDIFYNLIILSELIRVLFKIIFKKLKSQ